MINELVAQGVSMAWHSIKRTLSVLAVLLVIAGLAWAVYVSFIRPTTKPNPTTRQEADNINNVYYTIEPKQTFFGCANFKIQKPQSLPINATDDKS